jgi:hypothetical protein
LKRKNITCLALAVLLFAFMLPIVAAHAPLGTGDNESIDRATVIPDPTKSWALYTALNSDGDPQYYTFNVTEGQTIHVLMYKSLRERDTTFNPVLVLVGQNVNATDDVPSKITVPSGYSAELIHTTTPQKAYEPFSPGTLAYVTDLTVNSAAQGQYYLVAYEASTNPTGGHYGLAIGDRETYTLDEWLIIPFNLLSIYQWEGQSLPLIFASMIATLVFGIIFLALQLKKQCTASSPLAWLGAVSGLTFLGTGASTLFQLVTDATQVSVGIEVVITLVFALIPIVLGALAVLFALRYSRKISTKGRIYFVVLGVAALFIWAGYIIGPAIAIAASLMPTSIKRKSA